MREPVADAVKAQDPHRIGADAEIGGVAEADQAGITEDQIEADGGDGEDHHAREEAGVERRVERGGNHGHQSQCEQGDRRRNGSGGEAHQRPRGGNRPCGRTNKTAAIRM